MNVKRVMVWGQFLGGIGCIALSIALFALISKSRRTSAKGGAAAVILMFVGPWLMATSYQRGCGKCQKPLTATHLLFPLEQLEGIKQDLQNGSTATLAHPQPINRQLPKFASIKGEFCQHCGDLATVQVGEQVYSRPNDERSGKFHPQGEKREITGPAALAIKQMSMVVSTKT